MTRRRTFSRDSETYETELSGARAVVRRGKNGKLRTTEKVFDNELAAMQWVRAQELKKLRTGLILNSDQPAIGEPLSVMALPRTYTGLLPIVGDSTGEVISTFLDPDTEKEVLFVTDGAEAYVLRRSKSEMTIAAALHGDNIYIRTNKHRVIRLDEDGKETVVARPPKLPASVLSIHQDRALWLDGSSLQVVDLGSSEVAWSKDVEIGSHKGSALCTAAMNGDWVSYSTSPGKIEVVNIATNQSHTIDTDIQVINQMIIVGEWLYVCELYGQLGVYCFDIKTGQSRADWSPIVDGQLHAIASSSDSRHLAVQGGNQLSVYSTKSNKLVRQIDIEYAVKRSGIAWIDDSHVAVRTDAGTLAVYRVI